MCVMLGLAWTFYFHCVIITGQHLVFNKSKLQTDLLVLKTFWGIHIRKQSCNICWHVFFLCMATPNWKRVWFIMCRPYKQGYFNILPFLNVFGDMSIFQPLFPWIPFGLKLFTHNNMRTALFCMSLHTLWSITTLQPYNLRLDIYTSFIQCCICAVSNVLCVFKLATIDPNALQSLVNY